MKYKKIRTVVHKNLIDYYLKKGCLLSIPGGVLLLLSGIYSSRIFLENWGIYIILFIFFLIGYGWFPYKKLNRLQHHPEEIHIYETYFEYYKNKKMIDKIYFKDTLELLFITHKNHYGIQINKNKLFPFFNKKAFNTLKEFYDS